MPAYVEDWLSHAGRAIREYADVLKHLRDGREYHRQRAYRDDDDRTASSPRIEIPLLWGMF